MNKKQNIKHCMLFAIKLLLIPILLSRADSTATLGCRDSTDPNPVPNLYGSSPIPSPFTAEYYSYTVRFADNTTVSGTTNLNYLVVFFGAKVEIITLEYNCRDPSEQNPHVTELKYHRYRLTSDSCYQMERCPPLTGTPSPTFSATQSVTRSPTPTVTPVPHNPPPYHPPPQLTPYQPPARPPYYYPTYPRPPKSQGGDSSDSNKGLLYLLFLLLLIPVILCCLLLCFLIFVIYRRMIRGRVDNQAPVYHW